MQPKHRGGMMPQVTELLRGNFDVPCIESEETTEGGGAHASSASSAAPQKRRRRQPSSSVQEATSPPALARGLAGER